MSELTTAGVFCDGCGVRGEVTELSIGDDEDSVWTGFPSGWLVLDTIIHLDEELACCIDCARKVMAKRSGRKQARRALSEMSRRRA